MTYAVQNKEESVKAKDQEFVDSINDLVRRLGAILDAKPTPISTFKVRYRGILRAADHGKVQMISRGNKRYVLLTEMQLVQIMGEAFWSKPCALADTLELLSPVKKRLNSRDVILAGSEHDPFALPGRTH